VSEAKAFANRVQYPVLVRPSYVLSGAAMSVIRSESELEEKLQAASSVVCFSFTCAALSFSDASS
jgi:carbamoyl-phosphate synthase large subunit